MTVPYLFWSFDTDLVVIRKSGILFIDDMIMYNVAEYVLIVFNNTVG